MSEETTRNLSDNRSFEERVFARFDAMESRFDAVDLRLDRFDIRLHALEARTLDTKPVWERALAEILNVKERVESIERKFDVLTLDMMQLRGDQRRVEKRMDALESRPQ
jgi:tetrahydromethanopterin S-methyltransferase subunit G